MSGHFISEGAAEQLERELLKCVLFMQHTPPVFGSRTFASMVITAAMQVQGWTQEELDAVKAPCGTEGCKCHEAVGRVIDFMRTVPTDEEGIGAQKFTGASALLVVGFNPEAGGEDAGGQ